MEKTQEQARQEILDLVADYCRTYHINNKKKYEPGDRIPYASRVYDEAEMVNLVDSALEFWLTSGRYTDEFEAKLAEYFNCVGCSLNPLDILDSKKNKGIGAPLMAGAATGAMPLGGAQAGTQGNPPVGPDGKPLPVKAGETAEKPVSFAVQLLIFGLCVVVAVGITAYSIFSNLVLTSDNMTLKARVSDLSYAQNIYDVYNQTKKDYDWTKLLESASSNKNDEITGFVDELEQKLPSEAKLVNMSVTTDGVSMTIKTGSKDIAADVIAQLRTFESIMVSNVSTITEEVDETGASKVQFTVDCTYVKADDSAASESADGTGSESADTSQDASSQIQTDSNSSSDTDSTNQ